MKLPNKYPFPQLLENRLKELVMSKAQLVQKIGYKNTGKGMRRLDNWMKGVKIPDEFQDKLAIALEVDPVVLDNAIQETKQQIQKEREDKERKKFKPHLFAMCANSRPSPIFVGGLTYGMRFIYLNESFLELEYIDQLAEVRTLILEHFSSNEGGIGGFGKIRYYVLRRDYDEEDKDQEIFDTEGVLEANPHPNLYRNPGKPGGLSVGGKKIEGLPGLGDKNEFK